MKHRIIIDMLRSGGNKRARVPERIVLPRVSDLVKTVQKLWRERRRDLPEDDPGVELVGADLSDAYCHFGVAGPELKNCLAPADPVYPGQMVLFRAMLFGFKGAPLIMGRLAAAFSRLWQAMLWKDKGGLQTYMDDPVVVLMGSLEERRSLLAMLLYTARAFGINLAFHKGERGLQLTWVGVRVEVRPGGGDHRADHPGEDDQGAQGQVEGMAGKGDGVPQGAASSDRPSLMAGRGPP